LYYFTSKQNKKQTLLWALIKEKMDESDKQNRSCD